MSTIGEAAAALAAAAAVDGVRSYQVGASPVDPPGVIIGPPRLEWSAHCPGPTLAIFEVFVIVAVDERAMERLWTITPAVADAIDEGTEGVVLRAEPGTYNAGTGELPCYQLSVEYPI